MNRRTAIFNEHTSAARAQNVSETEMWWNAEQDTAAWDAPLEGDLPLTSEKMKERESRLHVDHVQDMVPFWIRGVEAAEHGEVLRLEKFLDTLQRDSWIDGDPWKYAYSAGEWDHHSQLGQRAWNRCGDVGWGPRWHDKATSSMYGHRTRTDSHTMEMERRKKNSRKKVKMKSPRATYQSGSGGDAYAFVEGIARQEAADAERKRRMHMFFEVRL
jgi:hypothetical protein